MILKGSQRGGAKQLAIHLLRVDENDHVELHEVKGFISDDLGGALREAYAVSKGTRCQQFLFLLSLSPPEKERVPVEMFKLAIDEIEAMLGWKANFWSGKTFRSKSGPCAGTMKRWSARSIARSRSFSRATPARSCTAKMNQCASTVGAARSYSSQIFDKSGEWNETKERSWQRSPELPKNASESAVWVRRYLTDCTIAETAKPPTGN